MLFRSIRSAPGYGFVFGAQMGDRFFKGIDKFSRDGWLDEAASKGWITKDITDINLRINRMCGKGKFSKAKRDEITFRVYNHYRDSEEMSVLSWKSASSISTWLETKKYINNDKVIYYPVSHSTPSKGITGAAKMAFDNPGKEIRVVVHTSILTAFDIERCYINRVKEFVTEWENILQKISSGYFNGKVR